MDLKALRVDRKKATEGVWFDVDDKGAKVLVARWGNENFERVRDRLAKPFVIAARNGMLTNRQAETVLNKAAAETILLGWEGIKLDNKAFPYTPENALRVMTDPEFEDFADLIKGLSQEQSAFRAAEIEDAVKN